MTDDGTRTAAQQYHSSGECVFSSSASVQTRLMLCLVVDE